MKREERLVLTARWLLERWETRELGEIESTKTWEELGIADDPELRDLIEATEIFCGYTIGLGYGHA